MRIEITVEGQEPITHKLTKEKTLLGAGSDSDIVVQAEGISRKHVMILAEGDQFFVVDQGSTNGAFINEERLVPGQRASFTSFFPVKLGAQVTIALLSDEEAGQSFEFAKELSAQAEKSSPNRTAPSPLGTDTKTGHQTRSGFSSAPASRRTLKPESIREKKKSISEKENAQSQLIKILAFVVAFGGSALFFYSKESADEEAAAQAAALAQVEAAVKEVPPVDLMSFELRPLLPIGVASATSALSELKCSSEDELRLCRGLGLPVKNFGLSGAVFANLYISLVLPHLSSEDLVAHFTKDGRWDENVKEKLKKVEDPRDLIAMYIVSAPLDVWARIPAEKRWVYVLLVNKNGARQGDVWVADLNHIRSLGTRPEEFFALQSNFRAQGSDALTSLAGLFRYIPSATP